MYTAQLALTPHSPVQAMVLGKEVREEIRDLDARNFLSDNILSH